MKHQYIVATILGLVAALIITTIVFVSRQYSSMIVQKKVDRNTLITPSVTPTPDPLRAYSIALLGYGGANHDGGRLTDSILVAKIEPHFQKITLISVPRDLWVNLPLNGDSTSGYKINAAYAIGVDDRNYPNKKTEFTGPAGGGEMSKYIIGKVLGFNINYFVSLDFTGFVKVIDQLGGVDVKVQRTLDDPFYPIDIGTTDTCGKSETEIQSLAATMSGEKLDQQFTCRFEHLHFDIGTTRLNGQTALKYVRSRHGQTDGGDFNRANRQRNLILAVKEKIVSVNFIPKIIPIFNTLSRNLQTDISTDRIQQFITDIPELSQYKISSIALTDQNVLTQGRSPDRQMILLPKAGLDDFSQVHQFILSGGVLPTITPSPVPTKPLQ